jgi:hypothetical protein
MAAPFVYGRLALEDNFTNRSEEIKQLVFNFTSLTNTVLISPRRWGKSSLVTKAAGLAQKKEKNLRFCFLDLYNVRTEEQFYQLLVQEVLRMSSSKLEEIMEYVKKFMGQFIPRISFGPDSGNEITVGLDWKEVKKHPDEILNLSEKIAVDKGIKIIICIDEFQNISAFREHISIQKKLRSNWQRHQNTAYCLYGSKRHMLMDVFTSSSMPFYKFGDIHFLEKIKKKDWIPFIMKRFEETGKKIESAEAETIASLTECHPYYVQQLAQQTWFRTEYTCNSEIVKAAYEAITLQLSLLFQTLTDELATSQVNFLNAIIEGEKHLSSKHAIEKYHLGTSANVLQIKRALINKEIIDIQGDGIIILDPVYKHWLAHYYF